MNTKRYAIPKKRFADQVIAVPSGRSCRFSNTLCHSLGLLLRHNLRKRGRMLQPSGTIVRNEELDSFNVQVRHSLRHMCRLAKRPRMPPGEFTGAALGSQLHHEIFLWPNYLIFQPSFSLPKASPPTCRSNDNDL